MTPAWTKSLTRSFSGLTAGVGVFIAAQTTSLAQQAAPADTAPPPGALPALQGAEPALGPGLGQQDPADARRGLLSGIDDYFDHNYSVHGGHGGLWISPPTRTDVAFLQTPPDGFFQVTRQYVETAPLRWDWLGRATGVGYGLQCNLGPGWDTGNGIWTFKGGAAIGAYQNPDPLSGADLKADAFVEAGRDIHVCRIPARLLLGTAFSAVSGPDLGHGPRERLYSEIDFPHLFGGKVATGDKTLDEYALGRFSGALRASCGENGYSGQVGLYYNHLEEGGKGCSFSIGPDVGYAKDRGVTLGMRLQFSPKFW